ncbi:MAG: sigma 54-interacting transcriptional regulator, partial [Fibrobacterota bacterium]
METVPQSMARVGRSVRPELEEETLGLFDISHSLLSPNGLEAALAQVVAVLEERFELHRPMIASCAVDQETKVLAGKVGDAPDRFRAAALSVVERVSRTGQSIPVHRGARNKPCEDCDPAHEDPLCHFVGVPILRREEVIGAIVAQRPESTHASEGVARDLHLLEMVAKLVGQTFLFQDLVARDRLRLMEERRTAEKSFRASDSAGERAAVRGIVGESPLIQAVLRKVHIVAKSHLPVLLRGESGTGKELFAQAIHELSPRRGGPMVKLNCAALPESMLESELFGHERGAFTGAMAQRKGRFELADGGTLFLDEIGEISASFQAKLLRVL